MKQDNNEKMSLKEQWNDPRGKVFLKLKLYGVFFLVVFIFISFSSMNAAPTTPKVPHLNDDDTEEVTAINFTKMKNNLLEAEVINVKYTIGEYLIEGTIENNVLNGTYEKDDTLKKIKYDGKDIFVVNKNTEVVNNDLIKDVNLSYLIPKNIIDIINKPDVEVNKSADEKVYSYLIDDVSISVYTSDNNINKINIDDNNAIYNLEYLLIK